MRIVFALFKPPGNLPAYSSGFSPDYADRVARNAKRHAPDAEIVCLTDYPLDDFNDVDVVKEFQFPPPHGWHSLMEFYRPDVIGDGPALLIGLDTIFVGDITPVIGTANELGYVVCGGQRIDQETLSNSVVGVNRHCAKSIWDFWYSRRDRDLPDEQYFLRGAFSEMFWMRKNTVIGGMWETALPGMVVSYKRHLKRQPPTGDERIVYFHGDPKPHDLNDEWIKREWTIDAAAQTDR